MIECAIPEEGSAQAVRCFFTYLNFRCPAPEQQTFDMKTKLWLDSPFGISFRQALGLGPELFRHYLTQQIPDKDELLRLVSRGYVTVDEYASILLWCLDGHVIGSYARGNYPDGADLFAELVTGAGTLETIIYRFFLTG